MYGKTGLLRIIPQFVTTTVTTFRDYMSSNSYCSKAQLETVYYCMPLDDGRMTETCYGSNIGRGEEELLR
jgi:hypothetical protein